MEYDWPSLTGCHSFKMIATGVSEEHVVAFIIRVDESLATFFVLKKVAS
jgi:hypothetical protein